MFIIDFPEYDIESVMSRICHEMYFGLEIILRFNQAELSQKYIIVIN